MAEKKRITLGRGLDKLLTTQPVSVTDLEQSREQNSDNNLRLIPLSQIRPGSSQPRKEINPETLEELAQSIRQHGVMQPVALKPLANEQYEIIAGERRYRAAKLAGLDKIPAIIHDVSAQTLLAMALIENIQREDLNPLEEALAIKRLIDEHGLTHEQVGEAISKPRTTITNLLRLLSLAKEVQEFILRGDIELGHAKVLLALSPPEQVDAAKQIVEQSLSVRETEQLVKRLRATSIDKKTDSPVDPDILALQTKLAQQLGSTVKIQHNTKGRGKVVIQYQDLDELDMILGHFA